MITLPGAEGTSDENAYLEVSSTQCNDGLHSGVDSKFSYSVTLNVCDTLAFQLN